MISAPTPTFILALFAQSFLTAREKDASVTAKKRRSSVWMTIAICKKSSKKTRSLGFLDTLRKGPLQMNSDIVHKPALRYINAPAADPRAAKVRSDIQQLRLALEAQPKAGTSDSLDKNRVKNLQAQLKKKNAELNQISPASNRQPVAPARRKPNVEVRWPTALRPQIAPGAKPSAPGQTFGTLGERVKGRLPSPSATLSALSTISEEQPQWSSEAPKMLNAPDYTRHAALKQGIEFANKSVKGRALANFTTKPVLVSIKEVEESDD